MRRLAHRRWSCLLASGALAALVLTGCSEPGLQPDQGVPWSEWKHPTTAPVQFSGPTTDGHTFSSSTHRGKVLVVNFWFAGCGPCRAEAPTLNALADALPGAQFVGVNVSDDAATAASFERSHHNRYPSIVDQQQGAAVQLAFAGTRPPKAVPSTLVLDERGRVTARIVGKADESVLKTLITDALRDAD